MRAPNHLEIKEKCREAIPRIMEKAKLGAPEKIEFDDQGWVNVTAFVNEKFVLRFNARDTQLPKFQREHIAFKLLKDVVPVPELLVFDESKTIAPFDYMICKRIKGENLEHSWPKTDSDNRNSLAYQAGQLLAKIHKVKLSSFGEIANSGPFPKSKSWTDYLRFFLEYQLREASELNLFSSAIQKQFIDLFESRVHLFDSVKEPKLIHGDYHLGNLLFSNSNIMGVLDFEWSCAGDPLFDICHLRDMESKWPGSQEAFNRGYGIKEFTLDEVSKMKAYTMIKSIELCVVAKKFFTEAECEEYVQTTVKNYALNTEAKIF